MLNRKVLIIDDEVDLCLLLSDYFRKKKYEVSVSHTLADGKKVFHTLQPAIVVLDNNLPDGTGWGVAPGLATQYPDTYFLLVSAFIPQLPICPKTLNSGL